ncbi:MAG: ATP-binding cassette domain-containing protein [Planctomycetota bacterium]
MTESTNLPAAGHELALRDFCVSVGDRNLLDDVQATFPAGRITIIVGGSGAGKSVLLRILAGLTPRQADTITWSGAIEPTGQHRTHDIGLVFQQFALFDELSAASNVQFAIDHRNRSAEMGEPGRWSAKQWLEHLGVPPSTAVSHLSGGQKQRLAIARTLAAQPDVVLYDEPTSGLDAASGRLVADLIRETQEAYHRTSVVVTHDYETLLPIADKVYLFDPSQQSLIEISRDRWNRVSELMVPVTQTTSEAAAESTRRFATLIGFFRVTGSVVLATLRLPIDLLPIVPRPRWAARFTLHYLRLVVGPSAWLYLIIAGLIVGFTSTFFTFRFLPFRVYTQPLLIDELLATVGFALFRVLVPILSTILIAARCGAAVSADVGVKRYGGQIDAMQSFGIRPRSYLLLPITAAFLLGTPLLEWVSFLAAKWISMVTFSFSYPEIGPYFWDHHFHRNFTEPRRWLPIGWSWVLVKSLICGLGTAAIAFYQGNAPKRSAGDVSHSITATVLWTTLFVLTVHLVVSLIEI